MPPSSRAPWARAKEQRATISTSSSERSWCACSPPWFENLKKRRVKSPKVYLRDTGLLHTLLGLSREDALAGHPKVGASFEGFVIEQLFAGLDARNAYFWATHGGAELDLFVRRNGKQYGFECKFSDAPRLTRSMRVALKDLRLDHLWVVYPGEDVYALDERVTVLPATEAGRLAVTVQDR